MKIDNIVVFKETRIGENRVALIPSDVAALVQNNFSIIIESQAGLNAGFTDNDYISAGAKTFKLNSTQLPQNSLILRIKRPIKQREVLENKLISFNSLMLGYLDPLDINNEQHFARWEALGIKPIPLELLQLKSDDPRNSLASMSIFAGRIALTDAIKRYKGTMPLKVSILGPGSAGLGAASEALNLKIPVQIFGRKESYRKEIENKGISYYTLPKNGRIRFIAKYLQQQTIVIAAIRTFAKKNPILIDNRSLQSLPDKAVLIDLCSEDGSVIVGSKEDNVITAERDITIVNVTGYPKAEPRAASEAFSKCMFNLLMSIISPDKTINLNSKLFRSVGIWRRRQLSKNSNQGYDF